VKKLILILLILFPSILTAGNPPTVCHTELSTWIKAGQKLTIIDIQSPGDFRAHNYERSIATHNDPLRLKKVAATLRTGRDKIIIVSADGGSDAARAMHQLTGYGVAPARMLLLEGGMKAAATQASCECCKPAALTGAVK